MNLSANDTAKKLDKIHDDSQNSNKNTPHIEGKVKVWANKTKVASVS